MSRQFWCYYNTKGGEWVTECGHPTCNGQMQVAKCWKRGDGEHCYHSILDGVETERCCNCLKTRTRTTRVVAPDGHGPGHPDATIEMLDGWIYNESFLPEVCKETL